MHSAFVILKLTVNYSVGPVVTANLSWKLTDKDVLSNVYPSKRRKDLIVAGKLVLAKCKPRIATVLPTMRNNSNFKT